jgi:hypothetical protein
MSRSPDSMPARLRSVGGTGLERRLLDAASREQPSRETLERMAKSIGIAAPVVGALPEATSGSTALEHAAGSEAGGAGTAAAAKASVGSGLILPLISGALVAIVAGIVFATRPSTTAPAPAVGPAPVNDVQAVVEAPTAPAVERATDPANPESPSATESPARAARPPPARTSGLSEQIALVDAARSAVTAGAGDRALALLRQYREKYPTGSFRPEASVLQIEALAKVGRSMEARALAERFIAEHRSSPLAGRAARAAGLVRP